MSDIFAQTVNDLLEQAPVNTPLDEVLIEQFLLKEGWARSLTTSLMTALLLVLSGTSIEAASEKTKIPREQINQGLSDPDQINQAKQLYNQIQSKKNTNTNKAVNLQQLLKSLVQVESGGNIKAIGDQGRSYGPLQIRKEVVDDVNRIYGTNYVHKDAFDLGKSYDIASKYLRYWIKVKKYKPTYENFSRVWNGGPMGPTKSATNSYWGKVKSQLVQSGVHKESVETIV